MSAHDWNRGLMGLHGWLDRLIRGRWIEDPLFGRIRFHDAGFWEGRAHFKPAGKEVEVLIDGDEEGPTERQRRFFRDFESRYPEMAARLGDILHRELVSRTAKDHPRQEIWDLFTLATISIPDPHAVPLEWELTYDTRAGESSFDIAMLGHEPEEVPTSG